MLEERLTKQAGVSFVVSTENDGPVGIIDVGASENNGAQITWFQPMFDVQKSDFLVIKPANHVAEVAP